MLFYTYPDISGVAQNLAYRALGGGSMSEFLIVTTCALHRKDNCMPVSLPDTADSKKNI